MLTLHQVAQAMAAALVYGDVTGADVQLATSRMKFWTATNALCPMASESRGSGRKRFYSADSLFLATTLAALAEAGVQSYRFPDIARQISHHQLWPEVVRGLAGVTLTVALTRDASVVVLSTPKRKGPISFVNPTITLDISQLFSRIPAPSLEMAG